MDDNPRIIEAMLRSFYGLSYDGINKATNEITKRSTSRFKPDSLLLLPCKISGPRIISWLQVLKHIPPPKQDRGLRDFIVAICQTHRRDLREKQELENFLANIPGLASDLVLLSRQYIPPNLSLEPRIVESYVCMDCLSKWQIQVGNVKDFLECPFCHHEQVLPF
ncbi:hypothetical protein N7508_004529 [Penicillium antarcticum]|uniref:uncharacterized protein n=1 Tax=Penicillium antarcticum TaxID=416450 RepID=UPI00238E573E|nr:uncharacterized protein N7508_004529 [Penicillium antarcticum]KAJ5309150.1 hypothetical protein N7508_004529 [Penicillium antarcticum]